MRIRPPGNTILEFEAGLIGIGKRQDRFWFSVTAVQQPGDPLRNGMGLAAARGRNDQHMPVKALEVNDAALAV